MRGIIILSIIATVCAGQMGYDYKPVQTSMSSLNPIPAHRDEIPSGSGSHTEFYTFSAPEDEFNDASELQRALGNAKPKLRVVFIKTPENKALENAALALAKQAAQQKTAIYVLNKQTDVGELANKFNAIQKGAAPKPEVHFVKYRTAEDAVHAQHTIQSQYDSLGGQSRNINGGLATVLNFASQSMEVVAHVNSPKNAYLPSMVLRL
ncbi:uncharacterized protein LOC133330222 [Musca vetustissima]|uniref:uncharacterized protein LOC133330222 n=1 Tax=Musca vetustissima TaxID=27455 RepID=UPI002AB6A9F0|nr:uncharacterized protein LOC133330222 [Musca vetustissima]